MLFCICRPPVMCIGGNTLIYLYSSKSNYKNLKVEYKEHLQAHYGIAFNKLFAFTNLPVQRFGSMLISKGLFNDYLQLLKDNYRPENLSGVMCRNTLSVDWQGFVYDCV